MILIGFIYGTFHICSSFPSPSPNTFFKLVFSESHGYQHQDQKPTVAQRSRAYFLTAPSWTGANHFLCNIVIILPIPLQDCSFPTLFLWYECCYIQLTEEPSIIWVDKDQIYAQLGIQFIQLVFCSVQCPLTKRISGNLTLCFPRCGEKTCPIYS